MCISMPIALHTMLLEQEHFLVVLRWKYVAHRKKYVMAQKVVCCSDSRDWVFASITRTKRALIKILMNITACFMSDG